MGNAVRRARGEGQKAIVKLWEELAGRYSGWEIWQDFIIMSALSIANTLGGPHREAREKEYLARAGKYTPQEMEVFSEMLSEVVKSLDENPDQDFLGELFMLLELGSHWHGQFFTPYSICRAMAAISCGDDFKAKVEQQGWISANDPACGAGALLIAFANECRRPGRDINYQTSVLFVAQDIDYLAGCMCYIQLSLLGCPGYVVIGDTLAHPLTSRDKRGLLPVDSPQVWYTPMYCSDIWHYRRIGVQMDLLFRNTEKQVPVQQPVPAAPGELKEVKADNGGGNFFGIPTPGSEWTLWGWSYYEKPNVTHWMPLPKPPKEANRND